MHDKIIDAKEALKNPFNLSMQNGSICKTNDLSRKAWGKQCRGSSDNGGLHTHLSKVSHLA